MVCHISLPLMHSFNKTVAATFLMQAVLPYGFPFSQLKNKIHVFIPINITNCILASQHSKPQQGGDPTLN